MDETEESTKTKYGKPLTFDRNFQGPQWHRRTCTDIPCLMIFLAFIGGWIFVAHYALTHGDLDKMMVPADSYNRKCGMDSQVLDKKFLFFFDLGECLDPLLPITGCPTTQVCIKECPTRAFTWDTMKDSLTFADLKERLICVNDDVKIGIRTLDDAALAIERKQCARWYIRSTPLLNRCLWEDARDICNYMLASPAQHSARYLENRRQQIMSDWDIPQEPPVEDDVTHVKNVQMCQNKNEVSENLMDKKRHVNEILAKLMTNFVAHFDNDTHDTQQLSEEIADDIANSWPLVIVMSGVVLISTLIFISLMRWIAAPLVWLSICGVLAGLVVGTYFSVREYLFWRDAATVPDHSLTLQSAVGNILHQSQTWLYLTIFLSICFLIIFLVVLILRKRIRIAIALTKEGSKAVFSIISTVFFPLLSWALYIITIVFAIGVGLYLGSIGEPSFRMIRRIDANHTRSLRNENCVCDGLAINYTLGGKCTPKIFADNCYVPTNTFAEVFISGGRARRAPCVETSCSFLELEHPSMVDWFIAYNVFGLFWMICFVSAFTDMVLAGTFATWYWTYKKRDVPHFVLFRSLGQTLLYHVGTLAFGSLILAICRLIRLLLEMMDSKLKQYDNAVTRTILKCLKCLFWLLEKFLILLNRNAYIMCAIHGKGFLGSAKDAFNLVMRNILRVVTLGKVTEILFFLSKILLTSAAGVITYFLIEKLTFIKLHYAAVPITLVVIIAFLMISLFFGVYSMAVDTLFMCFLEDCERNDGSQEKPYYMSKQLMKILRKRNKVQNRRN